MSHNMDKVRALFAARYPGYDKEAIMARAEEFRIKKLNAKKLALENAVAEFDWECIKSTMNHFDAALIAAKSGVEDKKKKKSTYTIPTRDRLIKGFLKVLELEEVPEDKRLYGATKMTECVIKMIEEYEEELKALMDEKKTA